MTLEQVIDRYANNAEYERIHGSLQGCLDFRQLAEWLKDYKRLLEQEPCERFEWGIDGKVYKITKAKDGKEICQQVCDDAISRQAVLDIDFKRIILTTAKPAETIEQKVKALPSVTPQPKTGHWTNGDPICPCCGEDKFKDLDADIWSDWQPKYCPNCGAKMQESDIKQDLNYADEDTLMPAT